MVTKSNAIDIEEQLKEDGIKTSLQVLMINSIRTETHNKNTYRTFNQHVHMEIKQEQVDLRSPCL